MNQVFTGFYLYPRLRNHDTLGIRGTSMERIVIDFSVSGPTIDKHIYGQFAEHLGACIYEGIWVGPDSAVPNTRGFRNDIIDAFKKLKVPNIRWPGGCFADTYHWTDGIGPQAERKGITNVFWGGTVESNQVGTHEFLDFCELVGTEPYICGNLGSGSVREMAEWLEYLTAPTASPLAQKRSENGRAEPWSNIRLWAVGNESWGCGGNMTAEHYANEYRRYQTWCRHFGGGKLFRVACGFEDEWNQVVMKLAAPYMDGLSIHYYTFPGTWAKHGPATGFPTEEWYATLLRAAGVDDFLRRTTAIMDQHDPEKRVAMVLDEWGTWYDVEPGTNPGFLYQHNTLRDALVAGLSLNIFHGHAERLKVANIAQAVNVLQAMVLTDGDRMILTPTYHVFEMFTPHQDATNIAFDHHADTFCPVSSGSVLPALSSSVSKNAQGELTISLCNLHHQDSLTLELELSGLSGTRALAGRQLKGSSMDQRNSLEEPDSISPLSIPSLQVGNGKLTLTLPPSSVTVYHG